MSKVRELRDASFVTGAIVLCVFFLTQPDSAFIKLQGTEMRLFFISLGSFFGGMVALFFALFVGMPASMYRGSWRASAYFTASMTAAVSSMSVMLCSASYSDFGSDKIMPIAFFLGIFLLIFVWCGKGHARINSLALFPVSLILCMEAFALILTMGFLSRFF